MATTPKSTDPIAESPNEVKSELKDILPDYHDKNGNFVLPVTNTSATPSVVMKSNPTYQPTSTGQDLLGGVAGAYVGSKFVPRMSNAVGDIKDVYGQMMAEKYGIEPNSPGEKWARKVTGYVRPGDYSVKQAAESFNMAKPQGKISGRLAERTGMNPPGVQQSSAERLLAKSAPEISVLDKSKALFGAVMSNPFLKGTLGGFGAGFEGADAYQRAQQGDYLGATLAGAGALGGLGTMTPLAATGIPEAVAVGSPLALMALDKMRGTGEK